LETHEEKNEELKTKQNELKKIEKDIYLLNHKSLGDHNEVSMQEYMKEANTELRNELKAKIDG